MLSVAVLIVCLKRSSGSIRQTVFVLKLLALANRDAQQKWRLSRITVRQHLLTAIHIELDVDKQVGKFCFDPLLLESSEVGTLSSVAAPRGTEGPIRLTDPV